jgi:hypothetical protein
MENWCLQNTGYQGRICLTGISNLNSNWILWHMNNTKLSDNFVPGSNPNCFFLCILFQIVTEHDRELLIAFKYFTVDCVNHRITRMEIILQFSFPCFPNALFAIFNYLWCEYLPGIETSSFFSITECEFLHICVLYGIFPKIFLTFLLSQRWHTDLLFE